MYAEVALKTCVRAGLYCGAGMDLCPFYGIVIATLVCIRYNFKIKSIIQVLWKFSIVFQQVVSCRSGNLHRTAMEIFLRLNACWTDQGPLIYRCRLFHFITEMRIIVERNGGMRESVGMLEWTELSWNVKVWEYLPQQGETFQI